MSGLTVVWVGGRWSLRLLPATVRACVLSDAAVARAEMPRGGFVRFAEGYGVALCYAMHLYYRSLDEQDGAHGPRVYCRPFPFGVSANNNLSCAGHADYWAYSCGAETTAMSGALTTFTCTAGVAGKRR